MKVRKLLIPGLIACPAIAHLPICKRYRIADGEGRKPYEDEKEKSEEGKLRRPRHCGLAKERRSPLIGRERVMACQERNGVVDRADVRCRVCH